MTQKNLLAPLTGLYPIRVIKTKILPFWAGRKILILSLVFLLVASPLLYSSLRTGKKAEAAWWDETWLYRKAVNITNSSGSNLTDFQVSFTLDTASLISAGKMQSDCDDIRVTDSQGNLLPHWIEENNPGCNNSATKIWTKVPSLPTSGATVYVYYGNSSADNVENGDNVFEFFDDFSTNTIGSKWTAVNGTWSINGGLLNETVTATEDAPYIIYAHNYTFTNGIIESRLRQNSGYWFGVYYRAQSNPTKAGNYYMAVIDDNNADNHFFGRRENNGWVNICGWSCGTTFDVLLNTWYKYKIAVNGTNHTIYINDTQINSNTDSTYSGGYIALGQSAWQNGSSDYDYIFVRKYASTEPSSSLSSTEEQSPGPVAYWKFDEGTGTTAYDSMGVNNGTLGTGSSAPSWQTEDMCVSGKCLSFDGSNDYVTVSNSVGNIKTVSFWVKPITTSEQFIDLNGSAYIQSSSGTISATGFTSPTIYVNGKVSTTIEANKWQHVVVTTNTAVSGSAIKIAQISTNFGQVFIDEVKLYPYARSAAQVLADYNAGKAKAASTKGVAVNLSSVEGAQAGLPSSLSEGLVGYWKMDESSWTNDCSTSTVIDSSGNGNHGKSCPSGAGSQPTAGKFGNAGNFDGSDDYVDVGDQSSLEGMTYLTVSAWVKPI